MLKVTTLEKIKGKDNLSSPTNKNGSWLILYRNIYDISLFGQRFRFLGMKEKIAQLLFDLIECEIFNVMHC